MHEHLSQLPKIELLDHGFVRMKDAMGTDLSIVQAARVSYDAAWRAGENEENDRKLLRRLWSGGKEPLPETPKHSTPFEAVTLTFEVLAPIFVFRQWHRHRTQSYNELSARYRKLPSVWYVPVPQHVGVQAAQNKQGRAEATDAELLAARTAECLEIEQHHRASYALYEKLLASEWPRELARSVLPVAMYSHMFATANLLNWLKFLGLRSDPHAQFEIRVYSDAIATLLEHVVPETMQLWKEAVQQ